jgi:hypothetical protein
MAGIENLDVENKIQETGNLYEKGFWEGLKHGVKPLPVFLTKPAYKLKPYEAGYWYGMQTAQVERKYDEPKEETSDGHGDLGAGDTLAADDCCWLGSGE